MKTKTGKVKLWTCPKCKRQFEREMQPHSCRIFPLEQHFEGKPAGKLLFDKFKKALKEQVGIFKIESLECCIHFVSSFTFAAVKIFKNKIRVDFAINRKIRSGRVNQFVQMSAHRFLHVIDIKSEHEIDEELMEWIQEARDKKIPKAVSA